MELQNTKNDFFKEVETELNSLYAPFLELKTDLSYLEIKSTDTEEQIDSKEKDAKAKKNQFTKFKTAIQKTAKEKRDAFNKASKDVIAIEKKYTADIIDVLDFLKVQIDFKKNRAEQIANELHNSRLSEIIEYQGFYNEIFFGNMIESEWQNTLKSAKLLKAEHEQAEKERKEAEEAERLENERIRAENERIRLENEKIKAENERIIRAENERIMLENERVKAENEENNSLNDLVIDNANDYEQLLNDLIVFVRQRKRLNCSKIYGNSISLLEKVISYLQTNS